MKCFSFGVATESGVSEIACGRNAKYVSIDAHFLGHCVCRRLVRFGVSGDLCFDKITLARVFPCPCKNMCLYTFVCLCVILYLCWCMCVYAFVCLCARACVILGFGVSGDLDFDRIALARLTVFNHTGPCRK